MIQLSTRWAKEVDLKCPLPEYPRPNMVRNSYFNLNGEWEYCINQSKETDHYDGTIIVPFSPETALSGVQKMVMPEDYLHYRKMFELPEGFKKERVLLHFGAVDQECDVFLNGKKLGSHVGGYLAFYFDVTEYLVEGENVLTLCVKDYTEKAPHARGKQKLVRKGGMSSLFYTPQSGIWKTVWLESVADTYVERVKITPMFDEAAVKVEVLTVGEEDNEAFISIYDGSNLVAEMSTVEKSAVISLPDFTPWTPETPHLYDVRIGKHLLFNTTSCQGDANN